MDNSNYSFTSYPDSHDSSPRSRDIDYENPSLDELPSNYRVKFMCSYGGKIQPRPYDNQLSYINGDTKIIAVDRGISFSDFVSKLSSICGFDVYFKYQLPGEELDALITVGNDEDLSNMMLEYERFYRASVKPARLRLFLFQLQSATFGFGTSDTKSERQWFADSLNSVQIQTLETSSAAVAEPGSPDFLFGFDKGISSDPLMKRRDSSPPALNPAVPDVYSGGSDVSNLDNRYLVADHPQVVPQAEIQRQILELQRLQIANQDNNPPVAYPGNFYRQPETLPPPPPVYWQERNMTSGNSAYSDHHLHHHQQEGQQQQPVFLIPAPGAYQAASIGHGGQVYYNVPPSMVHCEKPPLYCAAPNQSSQNFPTVIQQQCRVGGYGEEDVADGGGYAFDGARKAVYFTSAGGGPYQAAVDGRQYRGMSEDGNVRKTTNSPL